MRVLVVEDDRMIGEALEGALRDQACAVDRVESGPAALHAAAVQQYDAIVLDLGLPGMDGTGVLRELRRAKNPVPVLVLTARDAIDERVNALDAGADDFVAKPFAMAELMARIRAVLRRRQGAAEPMLGNALITLDPVTRRARVAEAEWVQLSNREYALLHALVQRPGAILSRAELEERIYGWGEEVESNAVEFLIHGLRRKLGSDAIRNVRGLGWLVAGDR
jgi:two-component system OmpR family response regulator